MNTPDQGSNHRPKGARPAGLPKGARPAGLPKGAKPAGLPKGAKPAGLPPTPTKQPGRPPHRSVPTVPIGIGGNGALAQPTRKDYMTSQDVRWCPGCGDYAILATVQRLMPELGIARENTVFVSGIGCSSRFPYYMNTYGLHSIHGRAPTIATGIKAVRPDLDVWIVSGDGDALSIGGNHLIHLLRRNLDVQMLLFNNQIYGLTKGQYSPTSEQGKITKSTPHGSIDHPFNPVSLALGAEATFVARTMDRDPKHMREIIRRGHAHDGASFIEIYQNCNIFNDGAFFQFTERHTKAKSTLFLNHGKPLVYDSGKRGLRLDGLRVESISLTSGRWSADDCLVHDETSIELANILGRMFWQDDLPRPFGIFFREERATYEELMRTQIEGITQKYGEGDLAALLNAGDTWTIEEGYEEGY